MVFWISFRTDSARCNEKRRALWSSKNQIYRVLSRIFIHSHCKVRSHNPKGSCACHEKKRIPDFDHAYYGHLYESKISCGLFYSGRGLHKRQKEPFIRLRLTSDANCWYKWFTASSAARPVQWWRSLFWCERASEQKSETTGFGQENCRILHCRFLFKLTFWSSLDLGCWETCAETSSKKSLPISQSSGLKEMFRRWMRWRKWTKFPALLKQIIFPPMQRASLGHEGLVYNWKQSMCEHVQACAAIVQSFSKSRKTYECTYTNPFTSKFSRGLDKPSPKLLGQDKPRLELALGWISHSY